MHPFLNNFQGIQLGLDCWVTELEFADDIVILEEDPGNSATGPRPDYMRSHDC